MFKALLATLVIAWFTPEAPTPPPPADTAVCMAADPEGIVHDPEVTCCCNTYSGGLCCAETGYCSGSFVPGCACR